MEVHGYLSLCLIGFRNEEGTSNFWLLGDLGVELHGLVGNGGERNTSNGSVRRDLLVGVGALSFNISLHFALW